jgi:ribosomal 50S subunit-associated protein YjgA (DUF615 family)
MNRNQRLNNDEITDDEKRTIEKAASEFTASLKTQQTDRTNELQDFGERLTDYVPASPVKKKK